jgi:hypothetical protein
MASTGKKRWSRSKGTAASCGTTERIHSAADDLDDGYDQGSTYGGSYHGGYGYHSYQGGRSGRSMKKVRRALAPLLERMSSYDDARLTLEQEGGAVADLKKVTALLTEPVSINAGHGTRPIVLAQQESVKELFDSLGRHDIRWQVRTRPSGMPVYYVCRVRTDYWTDYKLVVEDLYVSPGFPLGDGRFVQLMWMGHERYHLRMSPYRAATTTLLEGEDGEWAVDTLLQRVGQNVLQAAWHEDQRLGRAAADRFLMPDFAHAIELLYLCLSAELCELRASLTPEMIRFFEVVYPQPAIHAFLVRLASMEGATLDELPDLAYSLYHDLARSFGVFLAIEPPFGYSGASTPLYKVLFANVDRVDEAFGPLCGLDLVVEGAVDLARAARWISGRLTEVEDRAGPAHEVLY